MGLYNFNGSNSIYPKLSQCSNAWKERFTFTYVTNIKVKQSAYHSFRCELPLLLFSTLFGFPLNIKDSCICTRDSFTFPFFFTKSHSNSFSFHKIQLISNEIFFIENVYNININVIYIWCLYIYLYIWCFSPLGRTNPYEPQREPDKSLMAPMW